MSRDVFKKVYLGNDTSGLEISDHITYLRFVQSIKKDDGLDLYAEGEDAAYLLELEELRNGKPVVFNFGYIGAEISPTFRAIITDIEPTYSSDSGLVLNIKCGDRGRAMRHARSKKVWKKKNTGQIFKEVADMYGMGLYLEVPVGGFMQWASLPQGSIDYMTFLQILAAKEKDGNYICFVSGNDLHLVTRNVAEASTNTIEVGRNDKLMEFAIKWKETTAPTGVNEVGTPFGKLNARNAASNIVTGETGVYSMSGALWLKNSTGERTLLIDEKGRRTDVAKSLFKPEALNQLSSTNSVIPKNSNPQNKKKVSETKINIPSTVLPTLLTDDAAGRANITNGYELLTPSAQSEQETINSAAAIHKEATHKVLTADLKEDGNPLRKPNTVITVTNVATRFIGNWLIEGVQHDVGQNTYITTSACSKNGIKNGVKTSGSNTSKGKAETEDRVFIGTQGADNGRVFERDAQGNKKTIEYHPPKK